MKKRIVVIGLALALCLSCLAGCGSTGNDTQEPTPTESEPVESTPVDVEGTDAAADADAAAQELYERYAAIYAKHNPDDVVMTINGEAVTWSDYFFWLYSTCYQLEVYYAAEDWSQVVSEDGSTFQDYAKAAVEAYATQYWVVEQKTQELGVVFNEDDFAAIEAAKAADLESVSGGDEEDFAKQKQLMFLSDDLYDRLMSIGQYSGRFFDDNFGENGSELPEADAISYAEDNGYMHVKHILVLVDSDAEEDEKAEKLAQANELLSQLKAVPASELEAKFDELMNEYSEDPGLVSYPDGYYFTTGEMYQEFEDASVALSENELSEPVESQSGYHIILRLPLRADDVFSNGYTLRYAAASELYANMLNEWYENAVIEYTELGESLDLNELFGYTADDGAEAE